MTTLSIQQKSHGSIEILQLNGILNADTSPNLDEILKVLSETEHPQIIIDMDALTFISSAGISCFIGVIKKIRNKKGDIIFLKPTTKVKRVFQLLDMEDFFQFHQNLEDSIALFSE